MAKMSLGIISLQLNPEEPWQSIVLIWTPLSRTAVGEREGVVKLSLEQDDLVADSMNKYGGTAGHRYRWPQREGTKRSRSC